MRKELEPIALSNAAANTRDKRSKGRKRSGGMNGSPSGSVDDVEMELLDATSRPRSSNS